MSKIEQTNLHKPAHPSISLPNWSPLFNNATVQQFHFWHSEQHWFQHWFQHGSTHFDHVTFMVFHPQMFLKAGAACVQLRGFMIWEGVAPTKKFKRDFYRKKDDWQERNDFWIFLDAPRLEKICDDLVEWTRMDYTFYLVSLKKMENALQPVILPFFQSIMVFACQCCYVLPSPI